MLFDYSDETATIAEAIIGSVLPADFLDALYNGRSATFFHNTDMRFADTTFVIPGYLDVSAYAAWLNENGSAGVLVNVMNGTDEDYRIEYLAISMEDVICGKIVETTFEMNDTISAGTAMDFSFRIPPDEVQSGFSAWYNVTYDVDWGP